ncbi:MAG: GNAT family N-acetyltransferase [Acidobacteriota bacterium]|nr:GNAT family N-acetyltransferase [Acidobacteriota bacterium]
MEHPILNSIEPFELTGTSIRLEPLDRHHIDGLTAASAADPSLYTWSLVPIGREAVERYVDTAISWRNAGTAAPFAIVDPATGSVLGSTRLWDLQYWKWPPHHPAHGRGLPDTCEIGYTWLTRPAIRTAANTEAKLLLLTHAFEVWDVLQVSLHTDERNARSRAAIERIGGKFEGILRAHRMAADFTPRNSVRYTIIACEWPEVKRRLVSLKGRYS